MTDLIRHAGVTRKNCNASESGEKREGDSVIERRGQGRKEETSKIEKEGCEGSI